MVAGCDDASVIGAPFYLMERLTGRVHTVESLTPLPDAAVHEVGLALVDALAELHAIDPTKVHAMAEFLRPEPYAERQLRRWAGQWQRARRQRAWPTSPRSTASSRGLRPTGRRCRRRGSSTATTALPT